MKSTLAFAALLGLAVPAMQKDLVAPVPEALKNARTAYLVNVSAGEGAFNRLYSELLKWKHFTIVDAPEKADVVFWLAYKDTIFYTGSMVAGTGSVAPIEHLTVELQVTQPGSTMPLWTQSKYSGMARKGAVSGLVKSLRKFVERPEGRR